MAISLYPVNIEPEIFKNDNLFSRMPSMLDIIRKLQEDREEMLLAVIAAGVPANCIALIDPKESFNWRDIKSISLGFRFIGHIT